jgi:sulfur relay (sulfurtransferase) DsrC/TusE family protein
MDRRDFIKKMVAAGIIFQLPWFISCQNKIDKKIFIPNNEVLLPNQREIVIYFLKHFFPDVKGSPSIEDLNTYAHINQYLTDPNIDPNEQKYFINGTKWIEETAAELTNKKFSDLSPAQKKQVLNKVIQTRWGTSWSSKLLTLTFESLLLDPLYYVNKNEIGWKWLHHKAGTPRPQKKNSYKNLLKRKNEKIIITGLSQL